MDRAKYDIMEKLINYILKNKWLSKIQYIIALLILGASCILFPSWVKSGTFEDNYLIMILTAIACYGGFIGWLYLFINSK